MVRNIKFTSAKISEEQLKTILTELGCDIVKFVTDGESLGANCKKQFAILAKKRSQ